MDYTRDVNNISQYSIPSTISRRLPNVSNIYEVPMETNVNR